MTQLKQLAVELEKRHCLLQAISEHEMLVRDNDALIQQIHLQKKNSHMVRLVWGVIVSREEIHSWTFCCIMSCRTTTRLKRNVKASGRCRHLNGEIKQNGLSFWWNTVMEELATLCMQQRVYVSRFLHWCAPERFFFRANGVDECIISHSNLPMQSSTLCIHRHLVCVSGLTTSNDSSHEWLSVSYHIRMSTFLISIQELHQTEPTSYMFMDPSTRAKTSP